MTQKPNILTLKELRDTLTAMLEQGEHPDQPIYFDPNTGHESEDELAEWIPVRGVTQAMLDFDANALRNADDDQKEFHPLQIVLTAD